MRGRVWVTPIDVLPDDVLVVVFDFCVVGDGNQDTKRAIEEWQSLVHVCRRWRSLVFQSPRRLNLRLVCTHQTRTRDTLDIWPALPLIVWGDMSFSGSDSIITALEQNNRVCEISISDPGGWRFKDVLATMEAPFPQLTYLRIFSYCDAPPVIPDSFLGGSAPRLQRVELDGIPFPGLPKLLLSVNHLVHLRLHNIPHSGYISPEAMVALLSVLPNLEILFLGFESPQSQYDRESRSLRPPKSSILPALHKFHFKGATEYLEDLVTFIDAPQLETFRITFFSEIDFDTRRLTQFINRTPKLGKRDAHVQFRNIFAHVKLSAGSGTLNISIPCSEPERQLSSIEQVCNSSLHPLSAVENLYIEHQYSRVVVRRIDDIENTLWLELLLPFTAVKNLYLCKEFVPGIAAALQELVGGRITEVLPSLQNIFVEGFESSGPLQENIGQFVAARQLPGRLIVISVWDKDSDMDEDSDLEDLEST